MRALVAPVWSAVTRLEALIAQIEGNFEPIRVDIDVMHREALTNVLTSVTPEHALMMVESYDRLASLAATAAHARGEKPASPRLIPVKRESTLCATDTAAGSSAATARESLRRLRAP
jgi:hypothetical protein